MGDTGPIDVVYTWVDGEAPGFAEALAPHAAEAGLENADSLAGQLRDLGELLYSVRSVRQNMPWVRDIVILTNGQRPATLKEGNGLRFVSHADVFERPEALPVFNSLSIECHLHRIPGLSDCFVYFNNDLFVGAPVARDAMVDAGGRETFLFQPLQLSHRSRETHPHLLLLNHNERLIADRYGEGPRLVPPHTPQVYLRRGCEAVVRMWPEAVAATAGHRFRRTASAFFRVLYTYLRLYETYGILPLADIMIRHFDRVRLVTPQDCLTLTLTSAPGQLAAEFARLAQTRPTFFCVQDHLWADFEAARADLQAVLGRLFPIASPHESAGAR